MTEPRIQRSAGGAVLYDGARLAEFAEQWFEEAFWLEKNALLGTAPGRGSTLLIESEFGRWVLRHYHRGGLVSRFINDHYLWLGLERTRAFREWRLLSTLFERGLPVPRPVAARVRRRGVAYKADLITAYIQDTNSVASLLREGEALLDVWENVGAAIRTFHEHGVDHADLTAHNLLVDSSSRVFLVDFDRGVLRAPGPWREKNLARLKRSLRKVALETGTEVDEPGWRRLEIAYRGASA